MTSPSSPRPWRAECRQKGHDNWSWGYVASYATSESAKATDWWRSAYPPSFDFRLVNRDTHEVIHLA